MVIGNDYDDYGVYGVFASEQKAQAYVSHNAYMSIEEMELW